MFEDDYRSECEWYKQAFQQYGDVMGEQDKDHEWILTPQDTWVKNPHYVGLPGRHPEEDDEEDDYLYQIPYSVTNDSPF